MLTGSWVIMGALYTPWLAMHGAQPGPSSDSLQLLQARGLLRRLTEECCKLRNLQLLHGGA